MKRFFPYLLLTMPVSLTFANPLPQWDKFIQTSESLEDFAVQDNNVNLVGPYEDLPNPGSNNLVDGGINVPFLVAEKGFRVYHDPNDQRPVLEIDPNPAKIPPPNTPVGLCANTKLIGLCCDDHKDTTQTLRVNCQPCMYLPSSRSFLINFAL